MGKVQSKDTQLSIWLKQIKSMELQSSQIDSSDTQVMQQNKRLKIITQCPCWNEVKNLLQKLRDRRFDYQGIVKVLKMFKKYSNSSRFEISSEKGYKKDSFDALEQNYEMQLPEIYKKIAHFVLQNHQKCKYFPLFQQKHPFQHTFNKTQLLFLLCCMALFLIPKQNEIYNIGYSNQRDFSIIFQHSTFKTKTIIQYLKKQLKNLSKQPNKGQQRLTIRRKVSTQTLESLLKLNKKAKMSKLTVVGDNESIQDYFGDIKVDFANRFIGGGALSHGCVQQQIMFANHPQLITSMLLCQSMKNNEALHFIGFKKYHCNKGYSDSTVYIGPQLHQYSYDQKRRADQKITAIDAVCFPAKGCEQFLPLKIKRQIYKAFVGFRFEEEGRVVTGNWGCGAFGGDLRTKLLIQWLACSLAGKQLIYCPFGSRATLVDKQLFSVLSQLSVQQMYNILMESSKKCLKKGYSTPISEINIYQMAKSLLK